MLTAEEIHARQALLQQLRASGEPEAVRRADTLQALYHDQQMALLATDVYAAAKGTATSPQERQPPAGWLRASEHVDLLRQYAPGLAGMSDERLREYLKPDDSGFRAEIYLPDPRILGLGYKPVIAVKGSTGLIQLADGSLRETAAEDFLANNFPQSVGLRSDYYDRAMRLAVRMADAGLDAEYAGHSLGGGMASAMSAVTGRRATTFNAAGLHPETPRRFARENGVPVYTDLQRRVSAYQVEGELLNDGLQNPMGRLDAYRRVQVAGVLRETAHLLRELPEGRALLQRALSDQVPRQARPSVQAFVDRLALGDVDALLRELPLAAGTAKPLDAWTFREDRLVAREHRPSLAEVGVLARPVLDIAQGAALGAHLGKRAAQVQAAAWQRTADGVDAGGDVLEVAGRVRGEAAAARVRAAGALGKVAVALGGETLARQREAAGRIESWFEEWQGRAQAAAANGGADLLRRLGRSSLVPEGVRDWAERKAVSWERVGRDALREHAREAAETRRDAAEDARAVRAVAADAIVTLERVTVTAAGEERERPVRAGEQADATLDRAARGLRAGASRLPTAGAAAGAALAGGIGAASKANPIDGLSLSGLARHAGPSGAEALDRHGMAATVLPSLQRQVQAAEDAARSWLRARGLPSPAIDEASARAPSAPAPHATRAPSLDHSTLPVRDRALFERIRAQVPATLSDDTVAAAVLAARRSGIEHAGQFERATVVGDRLWVVGTVPGFRAAVDLDTPAPPAHESARALQALAQESSTVPAQAQQAARMVLH